MIAQNKACRFQGGINERNIKNKALWRLGVLRRRLRRIESSRRQPARRCTSHFPDHHPNDSIPGTTSPQKNDAESKRKTS